MKTCSSCKQKKDLSFFHKNKSQLSGYANQCKICKEQSRLKHIEKHREKGKESSRNWYQSNKQYHHQLVEKWYSKHPEIRRERHMHRYAAKMLSTPVWADKELMIDMYKEAIYFGMQVDHIVPLKSKLVCGLHWEGNMQLLTKTENASKGNRYWPNMS